MNRRKLAQLVLHPEPRLLRVAFTGTSISDDEAWMLTSAMEAATATHRGAILVDLTGLQFICPLFARRLEELAGQLVCRHRRMVTYAPVYAGVRAQFHDSRLEIGADMALLRLALTR